MSGSDQGDQGGVLGSWETVIGLEVHCELATSTKLFCGCSNVFGQEPNTNICPVCLGLPGSLPVLNRHAVELAEAIGIALRCDIVASRFHRKNYFYPDMPKDFQISQYDAPINTGGRLELADGTVIAIERAHLEEDTGKTTHVGGTGRIGGAEYALIDYNRSGVPLVEIVSAPDLRSAAQARAYAMELRSILVATGASDGRMEEGSMRIDANVSVRRSKEAMGTRCEIKNLNSMRSLLRAVDYEASRQIEVLGSGGRVAQETRHWDEDGGRTLSMRSKEQVDDYRYFPEPDLVPVVPGRADLARIAAGLGPMPAERRSALAGLLGADLTAAQAEQIRSVVASDLDGLVRRACEHGVPPGLALARTANEVAADAEAARSLDPDALGKLLLMEASAELSASQTKLVLGALMKHGGDPADIARQLGLSAMGQNELASALDEVIALHPGAWERYLGGDDKVAGMLIGQVMRLTAKRADGAALAAELAERRQGHPH
ncbi:MAG: Asp-tRNA(Asn)/Glu-tRNA(Gln) amidotransferase subunit GatB [Acidimicrobiales bacterium]